MKADWRINTMQNNEGKILLYQSDDGKVAVDVRFEDETFWLTQKALSELFDVESHTITYHLQEIFKTEELEEMATTRKIRVVRKEGNRNVGRELLYYNLDAIIAVGYRVNSKKATRFRQWATKTLKEYIQKFRIRQDADYISDFDREMAKYFKGGEDKE